MEKKRFDLQMFAPPENEIQTTDLEPAISVDLTSRLSENIAELQRILGIVEMEAMAAGTLIKMYGLTQDNKPAQVAEGETIPLTKISRDILFTKELVLEKYRKQSTAEAIQKVGRNVAINQTDDKLIASIRKDIKKKFFESLVAGQGTATGADVQKAMAAAWAEVKRVFEGEDIDATPIYFISTDDVADYLANAQITMQTAFGFDYVENFLGLGTAFVTPNLTKGTAYATATENLRGAFVPINGSDVGGVFGLTADPSGLVGMTHQTNTDNASVDTLLLSGTLFFPENLDGVIKVTIGGSGN